MANKFISKLLRKKAISTLDDSGHGVNQVSPHSAPINFSQFLGAYGNGSYDNNFANITRIAESFAEVSPYAVDANGVRLAKQPHLIDVLNSPNKEMSGPEFFESLIVMLLVHPAVYLLVSNGNARKLTRDTITGITFLEGAAVSTINGVTTYYCNGETYSESEVLALSLNINPYNLLSGYSPSMAAKKWATVDDYVADYQAGYFRNGAIPAGQFVVTAPTAADFNDMVDEMQKHHRGALQSNNPLYVHRPTSNIDGKPMSAQVEWVPFAQSTVEGALQSVFDQANKKIDMDFGVPAEVKGFLQNSTYASAEVAAFVFSRFVVYPKLKKVWAKLTHELNRVTGGLGFALGFDYEIPVLTDVRKVQVETIQMLINSGFTLDSAVDALQLPASFKKLEKSQNTPATIEPPAEPDEASTETSVNKRVGHCCEYHAKAVDLPTDDIFRKKLNPDLEQALANYLSGIIEKAKEIFVKYADDLATAENELAKWLEQSGIERSTTRAIVAILVQTILRSANDSSQEIAALAGLESLNIQMPEEDYTELESRIEDLIKKFGEETVTEIRKLADNAKLDNSEELAVIIAALYSSDYYRVERWALSEQHRAEGMGEILAGKTVETESGKELVKTWRINPDSPDICAFCWRMNGETVPIDQPFSNGQMVPHYHPHCYCTMELSVREAQKAVKISCPSCGRYMMESTGGTMKNVICANSKCKKHFDIEVKNGDVKAKEVRP